MLETDTAKELQLTPEQALVGDSIAAWFARLPAGVPLGEALEQLPLDLHVASSDLEQLPAEGAAVVVCNCPYGGIEPLLVLRLLQRVRPDVKLVLDRAAAPVAQLDPHALLLEPRADRGTLRAVLTWLRAGHCLVVFPGARAVTGWSTLAARLLQKTKSEAVPLLLPDHAEPVAEALRGGAVARLQVRLGRRLPVKRTRSFTAETLTSYLHLRTMLLGARVQQAATSVAAPQPVSQVPVVAPQRVEELEREIEQLPAERMLMESGTTRVYYARAAEIPHLLQEIGRLREETFRLVGEGTGNEIDLDKYDDYYEHLFSWDHERRRMVGAYRLGKIDGIIAKHGVDGLYTQSLFQLQPELFTQLGPALELGRSFIIEAHQKDFLALYALWCGIGRYVVRHPRYQKLFGAVSISNDYASLTRQLLMEFLQANELDAELARHVIPRNPPSFRPVPRDTQQLLSTGVQRIEDVEELVRDLESDRRGVPILLRQYLRLNGTLLAFNIDPDFGDVLDGLMLIDVTRIEPKMFRRFLGCPSAEKLRELAAASPQS